MLSKAPFVHKLLSKLERLNSTEIRSHFAELSQRLLLLESVLDSVEEGILLFHPSQQLVFANRQAKLWILDPNEPPQFKRPAEVQIADRSLQSWVERECPNLQTSLTSEMALLCPRESKVRATLIRLEAEMPTATVLLSVVPVDAARQEDPTKLLQHLESLVRLSAGIAHEIGNPLNAIGIHLELLGKHAEALPDHKRKSFQKSLEALKAETSRLDTIVRNFLKATRRPPLRFKMENLNELMEGAISVLSPELRQEKVRVTFSPDPNLPLCLLDAERLLQAFINLIKNAMEACREKGKGKLEIQIAHRAKALWIEFKDNGVGINPEDLPHIFEAYFTTKKEGSGLGLMTVYNHVREHGGQIEVESKPGKGTLFTLILPLRQPKLQIPELKIKS